MSGPAGVPDFVLGLPATGDQSLPTSPHPQPGHSMDTEYTGPVTRARARQEQARVANTCTCLQALAPQTLPPATYSQARGAITHTALQTRGATQKSLPQISPLAEATSRTLRPPRDHREAMGRPDAFKWGEAEVKEVTVLKDMNVATVVDLPPGKAVIRGKMIYAYKYSETGEVERHKARYVAMGCMQEEGRDYHSDALSQAQSRKDTIRAVTHIGASRGMKFESMDVVGAYLAADLEEEVYVTQPEGYEDPQNPHGVWRLHKALYGLKQSARAWYGRLSKYLQSLGFEINPVDPCLFQREVEGKLMFVLVHVDDLGLVADCPQQLAKFKEDMGREFNMKELGETRFYLGIHFSHHPELRMVHLHQARYIQQLLEQFNMKDAKVAATPMEENHTLTLVEEPEPGELEEMAGVPYAKLVGCLNFLSYCVRPDISCPVSILSRFVAEGKARKKHWDAAKRVLRYLKGTPTHGVTLGGQPPYNSKPMQTRHGQMISKTGNPL